MAVCRVGGMNPLRYTEDGGFEYKGNGIHTALVCSKIVIYAICLGFNTFTNPNTLSTQDTVMLALWSYLGFALLVFGFFVILDGLAVQRLLNSALAFESKQLTDGRPSDTGL